MKITKEDMLEKNPRLSEVTVACLGIGHNHHLNTLSSCHGRRRKVTEEILPLMTDMDLDR